jgi:hypothetical protein
MNLPDNPRHVHPIYDLLPVEIDGFDSLAEPALDLRSSWNHATDEVWRRLDIELWEITHNPWTSRFGNRVDDDIESCKNARADA